MNSSFTYNENSVRQIEYLVPRLKYSVLPTKIVKWLENFDEKDRDYAMDLLRVFEYIPFAEFMSRLDSILKELLINIPKDEKIIIFPFGKLGKSGILVTYPLRNTNSFKSRKSQISLTQDLKNLNNPTSYKHIIFLDDFIGSGNTFLKHFINPEVNNFISSNNIKSLFILSAIIMNEGKEKIHKSFPYIKIFADERHKLFNKVHSPLKVFKRGSLNEIQKIALAYGNKIPVNRPPTLYQPMGYDNSESLISFFHCTPNNTLPIFWGDKNWIPLFPREADTRMSEAKKLKKEIVYYLSICEKLNLNLTVANELLDKRVDKRSQKIKLLRQQNHAAITVLFLKERKYENIFICQILGLTREELKYIFYELRNKQLIKRDYQTITVDGYELLKELNRISKKEKIRNETENNLAIKKTLYLPQTFSGVT